jgi:hypothetical protein
VKVEWKAHTAQEIWDALKDAPKIAGPWEGELRKGYMFYRADPFGRFVARAQFDGIQVDALAFWTDKGREYVDERLRGEGWILLDDEEAEAKRPVAWARLGKVP